MNKLSLHVIYGNNPEAMVKELLESMKIGEQIEPGMKIGLKPNLVMAKPASTGATTHPEITEGIIRYLHDLNCKEITIMESSWTGGNTGRAFKSCGHTGLAKKYGCTLLDLKKDTTTGYTVGELSLDVCDAPGRVDYLINLPVLKGHCQTDLTCALKNLKGCIPDSEKSRYHRIGLHRPIAALNTVVRQDLIIVDGIEGDLSYEGGGNPVRMDRIIGGFDPVLVDAYAATLMGYDPERIEYIPLAAELGVGSMDLGQAEITELGDREKKRAVQPPANVARRFGNYIDPKEACSACFGNVVHALQRLKQEGSLEKLPEKVRFGQGWRGESGSGLGIGVCTRGFDRSINGCPPNTGEIVRFLRRQS